jgi:WD40 repeat protein/tRNA A-37 threonylcarbamoyl transferase component Bud32
MTADPCPDPDRLRRLLEGPAPEVDDEAVAAHLERCAACRAELERLAAASELPALRAARTGRGAPGDLAFLRDLKGLDPRHLGDPPPPTEIPRHVDEACDRFEAAWRAGERPRIEDYLGGTTDAGRPELLRHLLAVEFDYRGGLGESPEASEYRRRFPGYEGLIDSVCAELGRASKAVRRAVFETLEVRTGRDRPLWARAASPPPDVFPNVPGSEILSELGRGGMGVVYKARQVRLNRVCALKMILPGVHTGAEFHARFLAEAETIARLRHPNIVQIYGLGDYDGRPYFEMEYVEGGSLAERLDGTPWAPSPAARIVAVLARAIGDVHRLGIIHRDLKPANVLLTDDGTPKLADFGLAKTLESDSNLTRSGAFFGTPSYAAPEQAEGLTRAVSPAADIYALGAIFYHMLTGRPPFQAATALQTLEQVKAADPVPPSRLQPGLPRDAETICLTCLHKDPQRRYPDAAALAEDLDRFLAGRAILARPTGAAERLQKWVRRRPAVALLSSAVVAVSVLGFTLVTWQWRRAEAKAAAEAAANGRAQQARRVASEKQAELTFHQATALCEQGEVGRGLLWLARSLELATEAGSGGLDRPIRINLADWGGQLSRPLRLPPLRHPSPILGFAFRRQGRSLLSVGKDGVARVWDTATGKEVEPPLELRSDPSITRLERAGFGPGESGLLGAVDDRGRATVWDVNRRRRLASLPACAREHRVRDIAFPDSRNLITRDNDGLLRWWDVTTRQPIEGSPGQRRGGDSTWALTPDGRKLVTGGRDGQVLRWDLAARRSLEPGWRHDSPVEAIALTPDGRKVITGRRAGRLHIWDAETGRGFDLPPQGTEVTSLAVSPDGRVFASGTEGGVVRLWDTSLLGTIGQTCKLVSAVTALTFDPHGRVLAIGGDDGTIRLWEVPHQKAIGLPVRVNRPVQTVTFGEDGQRLLIGTSEGAKWWDLTGRTVRDPDQGRDGRPNDGPSIQVKATAVSPDGRTLAIARSVVADGPARGWVELREAATGRSLRQTPDQPHALSGVAYSPDSKWILTWGTEARTARLWDVATLRDARPLFRSPDSPINQAVFSRDGGSLLLGCRDGKARLWDPDRDVEIDPGHGPRHAYPITAVAFDPNRPRVVTGCHAGTVRVWDATRGTMLNELRQNAGEIVVLAFSPDGRMLLTASHDGTARFLDAESGRQLGPSLHHPDAVLCIAFHPDGQSVVTGTRDGLVQRWRMPSPPKAGGVAEIRRWVREQTGMELDDQGAVSMGTLCD